LISLDILQKLLTALNVFPAFLEILHLFGKKSTEMNEDFAVFRQEITWGSDADRIPEAFGMCSPSVVHLCL